MFGKKKDKKDDKSKKTKKKKLTRAEKKKIKERKARRKKREQLFKGQKGFFSDKGYVEYEGYVHLGLDGRYISVFDVLIQFGTHNPEKIGWLTDLIPSDKIQSGDIYFAFREKRMGKNEENTIFSKKINSRMVTMANEKASSDYREESKKQMEFEDNRLIKELSKDEGIIDNDILLVVKADTPEKLEETINQLKQKYKDDGIKGIELIRKTTEQMKSLKGMFHTISADAWHGADMESVDASKLFLPSSGFADEFGTFIGEDVHSFLVNNPTIIDFSGVRNAVIHTGHIKGTASLGGMAGAVPGIENFGSAWAHVIAEDNYLVEGHRNHYINLLPFDYQAPNSKVFDMNKYSINALETYGHRETVMEDANNNFAKVTEIIMMLLDNQEPDPKTRTTLQNRLVDWMINRAGGQGMYTSDPQKEPTRAWRILATTNHENYPTIQDFITELQSLVQEEEKKGEQARGRAEMLLNAVRTAARTYPSVFSEKTNIPDTLTADDRNIYYDLSHVTQDRVVKGAMFLNTLAYVVNRAHPGDMIIVTGIDNIKINPKVLRNYRDVMDRTGIGLITTFEEREDDDMNVKTLNDFIHPLSTQDVVVLGGITPKSLEWLNYSWNRSLPQTVKDDLSENMDGRYYLYRAKDYCSAVVDSHLIL